MNAPSLPQWSRAVVKVGSALVAPDASGCSTTHLLAIARFITESRQAGKEVILVSSGAVAAGRAAQGRTAPTARLALPEKQALAAIGQPLLMQHWGRLFDAPCAQVLLTYDDVRRRARYVNAQATLAALLEAGTLPIVNENDTVATDELQVGDNDNLSAYVAVLADADLLVICSDVDGLYDADPRTHPDASLIPVVTAIDEDVYAMAGGASRGVSTGGMRTKVEAADKATARGVDTVLINGTRPAALDALRHGTVDGTLFRRAANPLPARKHWMMHALPAAGRIVVDDGAARALREQGASLLPAGIVSVDGSFARGDAVEVVARSGDATQTLAKGITQYGSADLRRIRGLQSHELSDALDADAGLTDYVIHRNDMVVQA